jgi:uncharacterized glyoxalase superfamily protein PhnB
MRLKRLTTNLMVEDVKKAIEFYSELGFEATLTVPETGELDFAIVKSGDVELMFQSRTSLGEDIREFRYKKTGGTFTLYIKVENLLEIYERMKEKTEIIEDIHKTFYNTYEFSMKDNNGYIIAFAESE